MIRKMVIKVSMFGDLTFTLGEKIYHPKESLSKHLNNLLEVFMYYQKQALSKHQLIDMFWSDSINPESALKFSIHKLRQMLSQEEVFQQLDVIVTSSMGYQLNTEDFEFQIDKDIVDALYSSSNISSITVDQKIATHKIIVEKLAKPFLHNSSNTLWVSSIREYYMSIHHKCLTSVIEHHFYKKEYNEVLQLCNYGIRMDMYHEDFHYYYIQALIEQEQYHKAMEYYQKISNDFLNHFKTSLSPKIKNLYSIVLSHKQKEHMLLDDLLSDLSEKTKEGSYYCEYEIFKRYYQIALRAAERNQETYFVILMNMVSNQNHHESSTVMKNLLSAISSSLRKGDVYSRMNSTQCIMLVPCEQYDQTQVIVNRIQKRFHDYPTSKKAKLDYSIHKLKKDH